MSMLERKLWLGMAALAGLYMFTGAIGSGYAQVGGISSSDWNGEYWLMATMEGNIVEYDGQEFSYLANLGCTPVEMEWAGDYWLMGCRAGAPGEYLKKPMDRLVRYDGERFVNLSLDYAPQKITCSREYCLMFGSANDERLMKYDGSKLMELTKDFSTVASVPWINEMLWSGEYWLITTSDDLVKYDGVAFSKLDIGNLSTSTLGWNGDYWLVVLLEKQNITVGYKPRLFKYDGEALAELALPAFFDVTDLKREGLGYLTPRKLVWNDEYWLMTTHFSRLIKYDGKTFVEIALPIKSTGEIRGVSDMAWNGEHWLLSYPVSPGNLRIARYDEETFVELAHMPEYAMLTILGWTGKYWLIGTSYSSPFGIIKYDGSSFIDLTEKFLALKFPENTAKADAGTPPTPSPKTPSSEPRKGVCGPTLMTLMAVLIFAFKRQRGGRFERNR